MKINNNCKLSLNNVFSYDISSCHYEIIKKLSLNLSEIDETNKKERNIKIGLMMKDNPILSMILRNTTNSIIDEYLLRNNIQNENIILRQYDGIIISRRLKDINSCSLKLELKAIFQNFIISINRQQYLAFDGRDTIIKGVPYRYKEMDNMLNNVAKINLANKYTIFKTLEKYKNEILYSNNPNLYCIPTSDEKYNIFLKKYGQATISKNMIKFLDLEDIDRKRYFDFYIKPFTESIVLEFI